MKNIYTIILVLISSVVFSQNYNAIYDVNFKKDSTSNKYYTEQMSLYFNDSKSFYLSDKFVAFDNFMNNEEGLNSIVNSGTINIAEIKEKYPESLITHSIFSSKDENITYSKLDRKIYKILQHKNNLIWQLLDQSKEVNGIILKKAEILAFGRNWEAWYREDIPVQYGPYKFNGLPGLITELSDSDNYFSFKMIGFEKVNDFPNVVAINKAENIDLNNFIKLFNNRANLKIDRFRNFNIKSANISQQEIEKRIDERVNSENLHLEKDLNITF